MEKECEQELEDDTRINRGEKAAAEIRRTYEGRGRRAVLQLRLNDLKTRSRKEYVSPWDLAVAYAALGMKDETLKQLEDAYRKHSEELFCKARRSSTSCNPDECYRGLVTKIGF